LRIWFSFIAVILVLTASFANTYPYIPGYSFVADSYPWYVALSYGNLVESFLAFLLACGLLWKSKHSVLATLGLRRRPYRQLFAVLIAVIPLYVVFTYNFDIAEMIPLQVLFLAVISPVAEELVVRGFAFGFLRRIVEWGFWPASLFTGAIFGAGHFSQTADLTENVMTIIITGSGGVLFAWLREKWDSLWAPIGLHILMNFAWNLFAVGESAYAGTLSTLMQITTALLVILITLFRDRFPILRDTELLKSMDSESETESLG